MYNVSYFITSFLCAVVLVSTEDGNLMQRVQRSPWFYRTWKEKCCKYFKFQWNTFTAVLTVAGQSVGQNTMFLLF